MPWKLIVPEITDNDIVESYFKALGAEWKPFMKESELWHWGWILHNEPEPIRGRTWSKPDCVAYSENVEHPFPNILDSFPDFKKWVLEVMGEEGYVLTSSGNQWAYWLYLMDAEHPIFDEPIKDNNILHAAVIAATRYLEGKNG